MAEAFSAKTVEQVFYERLAHLKEAERRVKEECETALARIQEKRDLLARRYAGLTYEARDWPATDLPIFGFLDGP